MLLGCDGLVNFGLSLGLIVDHIKIQISFVFSSLSILTIVSLKKMGGLGWPVGRL